MFPAAPARAPRAAALRPTALASIPEETEAEVRQAIGSGSDTAIDRMNAVDRERSVAPTGFAPPDGDALSTLRTALYRYYGARAGEDDVLPAALATLLDRRAFELHAEGFTAQSLEALEPTLHSRDFLAQSGQNALAFVPFAVMGFLSRYFGPALAQRYGPWGGQALAGAARALGPMFDTRRSADVHYGKVPDTSLLNPAAAAYLGGRSAGPTRQLAAGSAGFAAGLSARGVVQGALQAAMAGAGVDGKQAELVGQVMDAALLLTMSAPIVAGVEREVSGDRPGAMAVLLARDDCLHWLKELRAEEPATTFAGVAQRAQKFGRALSTLGRSLGARPGEIASRVIAPGTIGELLVVAGLVSVGGNVSPAVRKSMAEQGHSPAVQAMVSQVVATLATLPLVAGFPVASALPDMALQAWRAGAPQKPDEESPDSLA